MLGRLGLAVEPASTQIVARDRHAEYLNALALAATACEQIALEIRHLQRSEVGEVGEPFGGTTAEEGFSYDCSWAVVARVQHLQHIHHRRNLYNGVLTLQSDSGRWKISGVELVSEDRAVVPWNPT